jgi:hypothetical protein
VTASARSPKPGRAALVPIAVGIFAVGLLALAAIVVLFVTGRHDLPLWLNSAAGVLIPLGLILALVGLFREARQSVRNGVEGRR